jgi:carboxyl-terminal processing protease
VKFSREKAESFPVCRERFAGAQWYPLYWPVRRDYKASVAFGSRRRYVGCVVVLCVAALAGCASSGRDRPATERQVLSEAQRVLAVESFEKVWTTIRDKHWDPEMGGIDWEGVRNELRPRIDTATTRDEVRLVMREMLERLQLSHYGIIPNEAYDEIREVTGETAGQGAGGGTGGRDGWSGVELCAIGDQAVLAQVAPDSAAYAAGLRSGMVLVECRGMRAERRIRLIREAYKHSTLCELFIHRGLEAMLVGAVGEELRLVVLDHADQPREITVKLAEPRGEATTLGNMGTVRTWFEARRIDGDVGYIRFNMFANPGRLMKQFEEAMRSFMDARGVIVDLRDNPGGVGAMAMGMAGWFVSEPAKLGTMITRETRLNFAITPRAVTYGGPLAILVDGGSASTAEIFAGGLQDMRRARVFGGTTAGAALPSVIERLPNGDGFQYAFANYISASGEPLEGRGVIPDEKMQLSREALSQGRDDVIDAALRWIREQRGAADTR